MQELHPVRHLDTGNPCTADDPDACEKAFPGIHHQPTHCKPVRARSGSSPHDYAGKLRAPRERSEVFDSRPAFTYQTTALRPVTR